MLVRALVIIPYLTSLSIIFGSAHITGLVNSIYIARHKYLCQRHLKTQRGLTEREQQLSHTQSVAALAVLQAFCLSCCYFVSQQQLG